MDFTIGVDIGGSAIKYAVVDQTGRVAWPPSRPADSAGVARVNYSIVTPGTVRLAWKMSGEEEVVAYDVAEDDGATNGLVDGKWVIPASVAQATLKQVLRRVTEDFPLPVAAIGIGATGLIGHDGIVREGYAFSGYRGVDWAAVAREGGLGLGVRVLNDARAATWAEYARIGGAEGAFLHVTVGTRVGCAIVQDGELLAGADACAGEFSYQQLIGPGSDHYRAGARLADGLTDDPVAFGAALTGVIHVINPNRVVLRSFAPEFVAAVQTHIDRYVFKTHWRLVMEAETDGSGSLLDVTLLDGRPVSTILGAKRTPSEGPASDFLQQLIVCAPVPLERIGDVYFGEIAGSFGIEADYQKCTGRRTPFAEIAALAADGGTEAAACLARAARITAAGIVNVCRMTGARLVTVGGAVPMLYGPYLQILAEYVAAQFRDGDVAPVIQPSAAGNDAGVIGAALYAMKTTAQTNG